MREGERWPMAMVRGPNVHGMPAYGGGSGGADQDVVAGATVLRATAARSHAIFSGPLAAGARGVA